MFNSNFSTGGSRRIIGLFVGAACIVIGITPLISLKVPFLEALKPDAMLTFVKIAFFICGLFILYDSFAMRNPMTMRIKFASVLLGIVMAAIGAVPLAMDLKLLKFLPFLPALAINPIILEVLLAFFGAYLIYEVIVIMRYSM